MLSSNLKETSEIFPDLFMSVLFVFPARTHSALSAKKCLLCNFASLVMTKKEIKLDTLAPTVWGFFFWKPTVKIEICLHLKKHTS